MEERSVRGRRVHNTHAHIHNIGFRNIEEIEQVKGAVILCGRYYRFLPFLSPTSSLLFIPQSHFLSLHKSQCEFLLLLLPNSRFAFPRF